MAIAKRGLGRGLSALIPESDMNFLAKVARGEAGAAPVVGAAPAGNATAETAIHWVAANAIEANPFQPRRVFATAEMTELVDSIREHGIMQPVLLRPLSSPRDGITHQLIAGERRWRAARAAGLQEVPALVRQVGDQQALELAVIENVQRHDISALDAALAYKRLAGEFGLSQEEIARRVGKSRSAVANTVRLLDLPDEARKAIEDGVISEGHGRAILLAGSEGARRAVLRRILRDGLSVREAESLARRTLEEPGALDKRGKMAQANDASLELTQLAQGLQRALGTRVEIKPRGKKGGVVAISYHNNDDLQRLWPLILKLRENG